MRKDYDTALNKLFKEVPPSELEGNIERLELLNRGKAFLEEADEKIADGILKQMPGTLRPSLRKYKKTLRGLSEQVGDSKFSKNNNIETKDGRKLIDIVKDNDAAHLRRTFRIFEDEKYVPT